MRYVVAIVGGFLITLGAFVGIMMLVVVVYPSVFTTIAGLVAMYIIVVPLAILAGVSSFRATLRYYRRQDGGIPGAIVHVGGVFSIARGKDRYGVIKVLGHQAEANTVYARVFDVYFQTRPRADQFTDRVPGKLDETLGIGIGTLPITQRVFEYWKPQFLFAQAITVAENEDLGLCFGVAQPWDDLKYA
jgi:hypothetical protein